MARDYDGTGDYDVFSNPTIFNGLTALSGHAWVNVDSPTEDGAIINRRVIGGTAAGFEWFADATGFASGRTNLYNITIDDGPTAAGIEGATNSVSNGNWQAVGFSFTANNANGLRLYVDDTEDANSPVSTVGITALPTITVDLGIGARADGARDGNQKMAEIACWDRVLSAAEFSGLANDDRPDRYPGLIWWNRLISGTPRDIISGAAATVNGTPSDFAHPPVLAIESARIGHSTAVAPSVVARAPQMALMGVGSA